MQHSNCCHHRYKKKDWKRHLLKFGGLAYLQQTSAAYFNSRWVSFNGSFLRYHICPHGSWHLVRLGIDHNSVELPDLINLIIVMHILKKRLDKFLKYTFALPGLHSWLPDISVAFSYFVFSSTDCLKGNVQQQYIYKRIKQQQMVPSPGLDLGPDLLLHLKLMSLVWSSIAFLLYWSWSKICLWLLPFIWTDNFARKPICYWCL